MIYVLTCGDYSDFHIEAATSDKEIADAYAKIHDCEVEEFPDLRDTSIINYADTLVTAFYFEFDKIGRLTNAKKQYVLPSSDLGDGRIDYSGCFQVGVIAEDEEQAKKIAYDKRAKFLAEYYHL